MCRWFRKKPLAPPAPSSDGLEDAALVRAFKDVPAKPNFEVRTLADLHEAVAYLGSKPFTRMTESTRENPGFKGLFRALDIRDGKL